MRHSFSGHLLAAASVAGLAAAAAGARPGLAASPSAWRAQLAADPTGAVGLAATTIQWLLIGLLALGVTATLLGRLPGAAGIAIDAVARRLLPRALRRLVHLAIGVTVGVSALAPAGAWAGTSASPAGHTQRTSPAGLTPRAAAQLHVPLDTFPSPLPALGEPAGSVGLRAPTTPLPRVASPPAATAHAAGSNASPTSPTALAPPTTSAPPTPHRPTPHRPAAGAPGPAGATARAPTSGTPADVLVVGGDSLWTLAARELASHDAGNRPSAAAIATEWPRWWAANRAAIGADPDLLWPGERLRPPA